jgi:hypothetical protein
MGPEFCPFSGHKVGVCTDMRHISVYFEQEKFSFPKRVH